MHDLDYRSASSPSGTIDAQDFHSWMFSLGVEMKTTCKEVVRRLPEYIEGGLDAKQFRQLSAHVRSCKHCGIVSNSVRDTMKIYADRRLLEMEPGLMQSIPVIPHIGK